MKEAVAKRISETKIKLATSLCEKINGKFSDKSKDKLICILANLGMPNLYNVIYDYTTNHPESYDAIIALSKFDRKETVDYFLDLLKDYRSFHRDLIVERLATLTITDIVNVIKPYLADEDRQVRFQAIYALYNIGSKEAALAMCEYISDPDEWISMTILRLLCKLKELDTIPILIDKYHADEDLRRKASMISFLARFNSITLLGIFDDALRAKDTRLRANAIEAIGNLKLPEDELTKRISPFLNDPNNRIRANAILAMAKITPEKVKAQIIDMVNSDDIQLRRSAAFILCMVPSNEYFEQASKLIVDENVTVRKRMIQSLKNFPHEFISANINKVLSDKNMWIRKYAVDMIASIPAFETSPIINSLKREQAAPNIEACLNFLASHPTEEAMNALKFHFKDRRLSVIKGLLKSLIAIGGIEALKSVAPRLEQHDPYVIQTLTKTMLEAGNIETLDDIVNNFPKIKSQYHLDMILPSLEVAVDTIVLGDKMPSELMKSFVARTEVIIPKPAPTPAPTPVSTPAPAPAPTPTSSPTAVSAPKTQVSLAKPEMPTEQNDSDQTAPTQTFENGDFDLSSFVISEDQMPNMSDNGDNGMDFVSSDMFMLPDVSDTVVKKKPAAPHYKAGLKAYNLGKYKKAIEEFNKSIAKNEEAPQNIDWYLGDMLSEEKQYEDAIKHLEAFVKVEPDNSKAVFLLGKCYRRTKEWQKVIDVYQSFIQGDLECSDKMKKRVYHDMGMACAILGKSETAIRLLGGLLKVEQDNAEVAYYLAMAYYKIKKVSDAASIIAQAEKYAPEGKSITKQIQMLAQTIRSGGAV